MPESPGLLRKPGYGIAVQRVGIPRAFGRCGFLIGWRAQLTEKPQKIDPLSQRQQALR